MDHHPICRWSAVLCFGLGSAGLFGCAGDSDASAVQRTDSAGVEIVLSGSTDRVLEWQFRRLFELGGADDGPESFYRVAPLLVGADSAGNLYVLDSPNARVVVFDAEGRFLRSMGSRGGGPGEFRSPATISVSSDGEVAVFDYGKADLVRFGADGTVRDEKPLHLFPTPTPNVQRHFSHFHDTTLVASSTSPMEPGDLIQTLRQIVGSDTLVLAELTLPPVKLTTFEECGVGIPLQPVFVQELAWATQPGMVAFDFTGEYSVSFIEAGRVTRMVRRDIEPTSASREQAISNRSEGFTVRIGGSECKIDADELVDESGYAATIPLISTLFLGPSGELWVQRFTVDREAIKPIDVFDPSGAYVGTLVSDSFAPVILLPGGRVGVVETDENDVQRLAVLSIQR